jgi:hypothetical protein
MRATPLAIPRGLPTPTAIRSSSPLVRRSGSPCGRRGKDELGRSGSSIFGSEAATRGRTATPPARLHWTSDQAVSASSARAAPANRGLWLKVKCLNREEFVVVGWTYPEGTRPHLGALLLAYYDRDGRLIYAGRAGTGIGHAELERLWRRMQPLATPEMPLPQYPTPERVLPAGVRVSNSKALDRLADLQISVLSARYIADHCGSALKAACARKGNDRPPRPGRVQAEAA